MNDYRAPRYICHLLRGGILTYFRQTQHIQLSRMTLGECESHQEGASLLNLGKPSQKLEKEHFHKLPMRGCSHIMSAKNGGSRPPLTPLSAKNLKLVYPPPPLVRKIRKWLTPAHPIVRNHMWLHFNL